MKVRITLKDPDGVGNGIDYIVEASLSGLAKDASLSEDELDSLKESRRERIRSKLDRWFQYDEYLTVEYDIVNNTLEIVPQ